MPARDHFEHTTSQHVHESQHGEHHIGHNHPGLVAELYGRLPDSNPYRHERTHSDHQSLLLNNPYEHAACRTDERTEHSRTRDASHERQLAATEQRVEQHLRHDANDFAPIYRELDGLRRRDGENIVGDLKHINQTMHDRGLLTGQELVRDDRGDGHGWGVVAEDKQNKERNGHRDGTMVSTSHAPEESQELRRHYGNMHHRRGHYNGWQQSVEGGGGAHGGIDGHAVGGHVPQGARRELIEEALRLAGVPVNERTISAVNTIVSRESGWNPNITNNWDSNARAGHPSTGLMQTIPSTFRQYARHGMDNNIHDPLSNLVAGIRYAQARYGRNGLSGVERVASRPGGY